jgi:hypothetical protein
MGWVGRLLQNLGARLHQKVLDTATNICASSPALTELDPVMALVGTTLQWLHSTMEGTVAEVCMLVLEIGVTVPYMPQYQ